MFRNLCLCVAATMLTFGPTTFNHPAFAQSTADNVKYRRVTYYYVQGETKNGPVRSQLYRDAGQAAAEMARMQRLRQKGGLLEYDPFISGPNLKTEELTDHSGTVAPPPPKRQAGGELGTRVAGMGSGSIPVADDTNLPPDLWKGLKEKLWVDPKLQTTSDDTPARITGSPNGQIGRKVELPLPYGINSAEELREVERTGKLVVATKAVYSIESRKNPGGGWTAWSSPFAYGNHGHWKYTASREYDTRAEAEDFIAGFRQYEKWRNEQFPGFRYQYEFRIVERQVPVKQ